MVKTIINPYSFLTGLDGKALDAGYIYIGTAGLNPVQHPVLAYYDAALTVTAQQPIRTVLGYVNANNAPSAIYTASDSVSVLVLDRNQQQVWFIEDTDVFRSGPFEAGNVVTINTIADMTAILKANITPIASVEVLGYLNPGDGGGGVFYWAPTSVDTADGGTVFSTDEGGAGRWIRMRDESELRPEWFAGFTDGTDAGPGWRAMVAAIGQGNKRIITEGGVYSILSGPSIDIGYALTQNNVTIDGAAFGGSILEIGHAGIGMRIGSASFQSVNGVIRNFGVRNLAGNANTDGIVCNNINTWTFDHLRVNNHTGRGILFEDMCISNRLQFCYIDTNGSSEGGFVIKGTSTNNVISGGRIVNNTGPGLRQTGTSVVGTLLTGGLNIEANKNGGILDDSTNVEGSIIIDDGVWIESNNTLSGAEAQVTLRGGQNKFVGSARFFAGAGYDIMVDNAVGTIIEEPVDQPDITNGGIFITVSAVGTRIRRSSTKPHGEVWGNIRDESLTTIIEVCDPYTLTAGIVRHSFPLLHDGPISSSFGGLGKTSNSYIYSKFDTLNKTTGGDVAPTVTKDTGVGFRVPPCMKIVWPSGAASSSVVLDDSFACISGQIVWISFKAKCLTASYMKVIVSLLDNVGGIVASIRLPLTTKWQYFSMPFTANFTGNGKVQFWTNTALGASLTMYVDELDVQTNVSFPGPNIYTNGAATSYNIGGLIVPGVHTNDLSLTQTQTTVGAAGAATALPANPTGYTVIKIGGTEYVVPYYAKS